MAVEIIVKHPDCEWIDVQAPKQEDLDYLHKTYGINDLMLEDTLEPNHLPKFEKDEVVKFFLLRENTDMERKSLNSMSDVSTKLAIFILDKKVVTVHRMNNRSIYEFKEEVKLIEDDLTPEKIAMHLAQKVLRSYDDEALQLMQKLDTMENEIFTQNSNQSSQLRRLYRLKRMTGLNSRILILSSDWVQQFKQLNLTDSELVNLKDKYQDVLADFDHLNAQVNNLISMFLALSDQKANQVMKLLAIYSVYFLPITFIAGLYGMNFDVMPELHYKSGYFATLGVMALITIITFIYFRRKKW